jgi:ABC-type transporter Mla subunit MlaD
LCGALALVVAAILFFGRRVVSTALHCGQLFPRVGGGTADGRSVTYRGVRVGQVKSSASGSIRIRLNQSSSDHGFVPEAVKHYGSAVGTEEALPPSERGLTAQLVMQSFVTATSGGSTFVLGQGIEDRRTSDVPEIPTVPSPFQTLTEQLQTSISPQPWQRFSARSLHWDAAYRPR